MPIRLTDLCWQVERDTQSIDAFVKQIAVALIRLRGGAETGVLPHCPEPSAIHRGINAAGEWERAWSTESFTM